MDIALSSDALDISFHPREDTYLLAVGLISGKVQLFDYRFFVENEEEQEQTSKKRYKRVWSVRHSHKSCRGVAFNETGSNLYAVFKDRSIMALDPETGNVKARVDNAHEYVAW